jgi:hypothetical protein
MPLALACKRKKQKLVHNKKNNPSHEIHRSFGLHQTSKEGKHHLVLNKRDVKERVHSLTHQDHPQPDPSREM